MVFPDPMSTADMSGLDEAGVAAARVPGDMDKPLLDLIHDCVHVADEDGLSRVCSDLYGLFPYRAAALCRMRGNGDTYEITGFLNHSFPAAWERAYIGNGYSLVDPVVQYAPRCGQPFLWAEAFGAGLVEAEVAGEFLTCASDHQLTSGISQACSTPGQSGSCTLLSIETGPNPLPAYGGRLIHYLLPHLHEAYARVTSDGAGRPLREQLTGREREVLQWAGEGKSAWEIGQILTISERTVKFHLGNVFRKLDVVNRPQAIARAMHTGLI